MIYMSVHKLLDIVWHNAVESLVEHRAWLAEDRRGRITEALTHAAFHKPPKHHQIQC